MKIQLIALIVITVFSVQVAGKTKLACVGNSITEGTSNYPTYLQKLLGAEYEIQNDGVSGTTMLKKGDKPYWTQGKLSQALSFKPDMVTIKLGTNDSKPQNWDTYKGEFKKDYLAMIDTFLTLTPKPSIYLILPVPVFKDVWGIRNSVVKEMLPIIKAIGSERNLPVIDANTPLLGFSSYFPDGVHPNTTGADTIAHVIYRFILQATAVHPENPAMFKGSPVNGSPSWSITPLPFTRSEATFRADGSMFDVAGRVFYGTRTNKNTATVPIIRSNRVGAGRE